MMGACSGECEVPRPFYKQHGRHNVAQEARATPELTRQLPCQRKNQKAASKSATSRSVSHGQEMDGGLLYTRGLKVQRLRTGLQTGASALLVAVWLPCDRQTDSQSTHSAIFLVQVPNLDEPSMIF
jgi:hypothetical protein